MRESPPPQRDVVFVSHANPEDNMFAVWATLQLANEGYKVWCDLAKLLGGELFWDNIEQAIRDRTAKFLYVLSCASNSKPGALNELQVAIGVQRQHKLKDFIIPLRIDNIPSAEITIEIARVNYIPFVDSWAAGLAKLLEKLEEDQVPKDDRFNRSAVNDWWKTQFSAQEGVRQEPELLLSNWFPVTNHPDELFIHTLSRKSIGKIEAQEPFPYPTVKLNDLRLFTFAKKDDFEGKLGHEIFIAQSETIPWASIVNGARNFWNQLIQLLRIAWETTVEERLPCYELANHVRCFYFTIEQVKPRNLLSFVTPLGRQIRRSLVGTRNIKNIQGEVWTRYWHFGVRAYPQLTPDFVYVVTSHVLFSNDGRTIWESKRRLASARRSQCKNWWNPHWRDRMIVAVTWLANGASTLNLTVGSDQSVVVSVSPMNFIGPLSYTDPQELEDQDVVGEPEETEIELAEEEHISQESLGSVQREE